MASAEPIAELSPGTHEDRRLGRSQVREAMESTGRRRRLSADPRSRRRTRPSISRRVSSRRPASLRVLLVARGASLHEHDGNVGHRALESRKHDCLTVCVCRASYVAPMRLSLVRTAPAMVRKRHEERRELVDQSAALRMRHCLESAVRAQLPVDVVQVIAQGMRRDPQLASDRRGVAPCGEQREDPPLLLG